MLLFYDLINCGLVLYFRINMFFIGTNIFRFLQWNSHAHCFLWSAAITGSTNSFHTHSPLPEEKHSSVFISAMPGMYHSATFGGIYGLKKNKGKKEETFFPS